MSKSEEGGAIYPEGVVSPREKLEYLKAVYGIRVPDLFDLVFKELIVKAYNEGVYLAMTPSKTAEDYYNKTFKSEEA